MPQQPQLKPQNDFIVKHNLDVWLLLVFILLAFTSLFTSPVSAVPTTGAATAVGSNNATLAATGVGSIGWFEYGTLSGHLYWKTPNQSISGGTMSYMVQQSPLTGNTLWYYRACDETGCGAQGSFFTLSVTPIPTPHLGGFYENITESGFNIPFMGLNLVDMYMWNPNIPLTVVFMLIFSPVFIGVWLRSRTVTIALLLGFITGSFILYSDRGLHLGLPPEVVSLAQAMCYISFAGMVLYILKR